MIERLHRALYPVTTRRGEAPCLAERVSFLITAGPKAGSVCSTGRIDDANIDNPAFFVSLRTRYCLPYRCPMTFSIKPGILCLLFLNVLLLSCSDEQVRVSLRFDTVVENGTVIDGTGAAAYSATCLSPMENSSVSVSSKRSASRLMWRSGAVLTPAVVWLLPALSMCTPTGILANAAIREFSRAGSYHDHPWPGRREP